jgi:membrane-bound lytic murein transglycosylase A
MPARTEERFGSAVLIRRSLQTVAAMTLAAAIAGSLAPAVGRERPLVLRNAQIEPVAWTALDGWASDDQTAADAAFRTSCTAILRADHKLRQARVMLDGLYHACAHARSAGSLDTDKDPAKARKFFEANFRPVRIAPLGENQGFLTGYYEGVFAGSRHRTYYFTVPI